MRWSSGCCKVFCFCCVLVLGLPRNFLLCACLGLLCVHTGLGNISSPYLAPSYRNLWSQWVSAYNSNTVAKPTGMKGRPKGVISKDGLHLLRDIHGYWVRTGNGSKRHQVKKNANEISHRRRGHGLNLDQMRLMELIVECNGQVCCACVRARVRECVRTYIYTQLLHTYIGYNQTGSRRSDGN